jgi:hypothetical protein
MFETIKTLGIFGILIRNGSPNLFSSLNKFILFKVAL